MVIIWNKCSAILRHRHSISVNRKISNVFLHFILSIPLNTQHLIGKRQDNLTDVWSRRQQLQQVLDSAKANTNPFCSGVEMGIIVIRWISPMGDYKLEAAWHPLNWASGMTEITDRQSWEINIHSWSMIAILTLAVSSQTYTVLCKRLRLPNKIV